MTSEKTLDGLHSPRLSMSIARSTASGVSGSAPAHEREQLGEQRRDGLRLGDVARDGDLVAAYRDVGLELVLDEPQEMIALAEQVDHVHLGWSDQVHLGGVRHVGGTFPPGLQDA